MLYPIAYAFLAVVLLTAAFTDWRTGLVYNWLTLPAMLLGLFFWAMAGLIEGGSTIMTTFLTQSLTALAVGLIPMVILVLATGSLGMGDAKLLGAVGALSANVQVVFYTFVYGLILALLMAVFIMVRYGLFRQTLTRLGMLIATREPLSESDGQAAPTLAFSVALAGGGLLAGAEFMLQIPMPWTGLV